METRKILAILVLRSELLRRVALVLGLGLMVWPAKVSEATPMGTAFTYQGRLIDANNTAEGLYDFQFKLYDANSDGNQVGSDVNEPDVEVIDGYFTVELDFGSDVFDGNAVWLETGVRPGELSDPCDYTTLIPRQELTPVPYALQTRGIFVDGAGNVGIGTVSPAAKLTVNGPILRSGSTMYGTYADTHINLGINSTTGMSGQDPSWFATVGGGADNTASNSCTTVAGGADNTACGRWATVAGGVDNTACGDWYATVTGGSENTASDRGTTVGGGYQNTASGRYATVPGGRNNTASGCYSFAAGCWAKANHDGAFVWADSTIADFASTGNNQFLIRASGGVGIGTTTPQGKLDVNGPIYQRGSMLHADYVFELDYKLESIEEHSEFMWQNKHLSAIPKAKVDEAGKQIVEVGAHRRGIVEELEKAHIYIEQLHKRVKILEEKLIKLEAGLNAVQ